MPRELRRPLPAGRYWADIFPQNRVYFDSWVALAQSRGAIHGEVSEHFDGIAGAPAHDFVIFSTNTELVWPDADMGFAPNVAGPEIHNSNDTIQKPPPEPGVLEQLSTQATNVGKTITTVAIAVLAIAAIAAVVTLAKRKR